MPGSPPAKSDPAASQAVSGLRPLPPERSDRPNSHLHPLLLDPQMRQLVIFQQPVVLVVPHAARPWPWSRSGRGLIAVLVRQERLHRLRAIGRLPGRGVRESGGRVLVKGRRWGAVGGHGWVRERGCDERSGEGGVSASPSSDIERRPSAGRARAGQLAIGRRLQLVWSLASGRGSNDDRMQSMNPSAQCGRRLATRSARGPAPASLGESLERAPLGCERRRHRFTCSHARLDGLRLSQLSKLETSFDPSILNEEADAILTAQYRASEHGCMRDVVVVEGPSTQPRTGAHSCSAPLVASSILRLIDLSRK